MHGTQHRGCQEVSDKDTPHTREHQNCTRLSWLSVCSYPQCSPQEQSTQLSPLEEWWQDGPGWPNQSHCHRVAGQISPFCLRERCARGEEQSACPPRCDLCPHLPPFPPHLSHDADLTSHPPLVLWGEDGSMKTLDCHDLALECPSCHVAPPTCSQDGLGDVDVLTREFPQL